mgnify:CR=1 FL=1
MCWRWNGEKTNSEKTAWGEPGRFVEFFSGESIAFPAKSSGVENVPSKRRIRHEFCSMLTENITKYVVVSFAEQSRAAE